VEGLILLPLLLLSAAAAAAAVLALHAAAHAGLLEQQRCLAVQFVLLAAAVPPWPAQPLTLQPCVDVLLGVVVVDDCWAPASSVVAILLPHRPRQRPAGSSRPQQLLPERRHLDAP
jgi:hypothetical protein